MGAARHEPSSAPRGSSEVRSYLKYLVALVLLGIVVMTLTAVWAWRTYGGRLDDAPPLPEGHPPMNTGKADPAP